MQNGVLVCWVESFSKQTNISVHLQLKHAFDSFGLQLFDVSKANQFLHRIFALIAAKGNPCM